MALARKLFVNWHTRQRQKNDLSGTPDPVSRLGFIKYEQYPFEIAIIEPNPTRGLNAFQRVDITNLSLKMAINDTQDSAAPMVETSGAGWTKDTSRMVFTGTLNLNTAAMNTYIDGDKTPFFELEVTDGTNRVKVLQELCAVTKSLVQVTTTSPNPSRIYLDYNEMLGVFVPRVMGPGESITMTSPNNIHRRIIGCNDDGTRRDDIETI